MRAKRRVAAHASHLAFGARMHWPGNMHGIMATKFVGEGGLRDEESNLVLSSAVQHPTGDVEMFGGQGLVAF